MFWEAFCLELFLYRASSNLFKRNTICCHLFSYITVSMHQPLASPSSDQAPLKTNAVLDPSCP